MKNEAKGSTVLGLILQLQEVGIGSVRKQGNASNLIWGHYDNLRILPVTKWMEYAPSVDQVQDEDNSFVNYYPIKLLFPVMKQTDKLPPLFYNEWKNCATLLDDYPCMSVVLLNFTNEYKHSAGGNHLQKFLELMNQHISKSYLLKTHCCVTPTLGYSDCCILMAANEWNSALHLVEELHKLQVSEKPVLATDYMMPVLHRKPTASFSSDNFEGCELSVRINMKPGIQIETVVHEIPENVKITRPSGGSDYVLRAEEPADQVSLLEYLLRSGGKDIILDITSTLQYTLRLSRPTTEENQDTEADDNTNSNKDQQDDDTLPFVISFRKAIDMYGEALKLKKRHLRQINALRELANNLQSICSQPHTGDIRQVMEKLIEDLSDCLMRCAKGTQFPEWDFLEMEHQVSTICKLIDNFLADLSRADCFFIERERYNHASISSATSLLLAYNRLLNEFTHDVRKTTKQGDQSNYAFLVTSGGRDRTETYNAFYFLSPEKTENHEDIVEKLPLVTQMSEMSLFDFSGTILRSFHECMHFCGTRLREDRLGYLTSFVCAIMAKRIAESLFSKDTEKAYVVSICKFLSGDKFDDKMQAEIDSIFETCQKNLQEEISNALKEYADPEAVHIPCPKPFLSRDVKEWIYDRLLEALSGYILVQNEEGSPNLGTNYFTNKLYSALQNVFISYLDKCESLLDEKSIDTAAFSFDKNRHQLFTQGNNRDPFLLQSIQLVCSRLMVSVAPYDLTGQVSGGEYCGMGDMIPYVELMSTNLVHIVEGATNIFSESFSDVISCKILGATLEDYLLMHVTEDWDPNISLEKELVNNYRIPAVLEVCFPDAIDKTYNLKADSREKIEAAIKRLQGHGWKEPEVSAGELCQKVDDLLKEFKDNHYLATPLIDYLNACVKAYQDLDVFNALSKYAETFSKIRLLQIDADSKERNKQLVDMYYSLIYRKGDESRDEPGEIPEIAM